jgi:hypothetical protein
MAKQLKAAILARRAAKAPRKKRTRPKPRQYTNHPSHEVGLSQSVMRLGQSCPPAAAALPRTPQSPATIMR